jgi:hypothetical protein
MFFVEVGIQTPGTRTYPPAGLTAAGPHLWTGRFFDDLKSRIKDGRRAIWSSVTLASGH